MTDINAEIEEAARLEDIVDIDPAEHYEFMRVLEDYRAGKALEDEIKAEVKTNRDFLVKYMKDELHAKKVRADGRMVTSISEIPKTLIDWAKLERLAPKALERSRYEKFHDRLNTERISSK